MHVLFCCVHMRWVGVVQGMGEINMRRIGNLLEDLTAEGGRAEADAVEDLRWQKATGKEEP